MANTPDGEPDGQPGSLRRAWRDHPATIIAALITLAGALMAAVVQSVNADNSQEGTTGDSAHSAPPVDRSPLPAPAPDQPDSAARWRGPITLPLSLNVTSDVGAELDGKRPGKLVGVDDDLRGDYSTTPAVIVMSGRAAETGKDLDDLDAATCEAKLPALPGDPPTISAYREGTYCFATSSGDIGAFAMTSHLSISDIPNSLAVQVVLWQ